MHESAGKRGDSDFLSATWLKAQSRMEDRRQKRITIRSLQQMIKSRIGVEAERDIGAEAARDIGAADGCSMVSSRAHV
jgi:hypothetical protein